MKRINELSSSKAKRKEGKVKSKGMMSLNKCFIVLTVSSRKGTNQNNVLRRPLKRSLFTRLSIYFPYPTFKIRLLNLLEFEVERNDRYYL